VEFIAGDHAHVNYDAAANIVYTWPELAAEDIALTVHAHPSLPEAVKEAALAVHGRAIHI
jgi:hypothetical protein